VTVELAPLDQADEVAALLAVDEKDEVAVPEGVTHSSEQTTT
jgi:hypothetical protein